MVGDGLNRIELQQKANTLECRDHIEFLGYRSDRLRVVKELDLFCMTSSQGIPRCLMEARAMGVPVQLCDIPRVKELILDGETGLLAPFGVIHALKDRWERLPTNDHLARTLARNGQIQVERDFSEKRMAAESTQLFREMVSSETPQVRSQV